MSNEPEYEGLHAVVVDAIKYVTSGQSTDRAAHEALTRLREAGLPIPPRPPDDPFGGHTPTLMGQLGQAIGASDTELHSPALVDLPYDDDLVVVLRIDDEIIRVKDHAPKSATAVVERGIAPSVAAPHTADAQVFLD